MSGKVKSFEDIRNIPKEELRYKGRFQQILIYLALALTVISLIEYIVKNKDVISSFK